MRHAKSNLISKDPIWEAIREEVTRDAAGEPLLASFLHSAVLKHDSLEKALSFNLAAKLGSAILSEMLIREVVDDALQYDPAIGQQIRGDLRAVRERDPACDRFSTPLLYFKGFHALQSYRVAHWLWNQSRRELALFMQNRISEVFAVDIHPAARIGTGIMIDHATGVVIGETAVVGDNVSMLHEVTLGGTGKDTGDRHPKIGCGVLLGAGAKILGNVVIGRCSKVGAGSVVLHDVPPNSTVAGVPAEIIAEEHPEQPALEMDHKFSCRGDC
ncbi:MAG: serine O-acetyltransferase [Gammaproteobacteria bacterium]|nr:serine O-acetyltransferase [Gammaproteobacteria bacterium]